MGDQPVEEPKETPIEDVIGDILQISPPIAVSGVTIFGVSLHDWVYICTIIYTLVGIATLIKKHWWSK